MAKKKLEKERRRREIERRADAILRGADTTFVGSKFPSKKAKRSSKMKCAIDGQPSWEVWHKKDMSVYRCPLCRRTVDSQGAAVRHRRFQCPGPPTTEPCERTRRE